MRMKDRTERILDILASKGYRSVAELASEMEVSIMTIRRDLDALEQRRQIRRTHGGAFVDQGMLEVDFRLRETMMREQKQAIGRHAATLIEPGESVFIDAGTTAAFLASSIESGKRLTVVTNSLDAAQALKGKASVETILLGGRIHDVTLSLIGPIAQENIMQFRFTKSFLGASGIDVTKGYSQSNIDEVPIKKWAAENSDKVFILADSSKFSKTLLIQFLNIEDVDAVLTDSGLPDEYRIALEEKGVKVILCR